ncbi:hypothetical protein J2T02_000719 [Chitinophaga terrae (ex Kim and Jung 2007)]|jgi:hypothetical protein|nr:hypothetical protein [Chitinophaga terrae (ex Kim and Jung 2007)]
MTKIGFHFKIVEFVNINVYKSAIITIKFYFVKKI